MRQNFVLLLIVLLAASLAPLHATVIATYDFEDGTAAAAPAAPEFR